MTEGEAYEFTVEFLRRGIVDPPRRDPGGDLNTRAVDMHRLVYSYIETHEQQNMEKQESRVWEISPLFMSAVWELCLLGVLRPGEPSLAHVGGSTMSYSVTEAGKRWLRAGGDVAFISVNYENFSKLLEPFGEFSPAFFERARDASLCWKAQAYFACCAMCGAAAEAVLLSIASAKLGDAEAERMYKSSNGRSRIENSVMGQARDFIRQNLQPLFRLISYWRDQSSHGAESGVGRDEALTALRSLFYYAKLAHEHWPELSKV